MTHDFYASQLCQNEQDVKNIVEDKKLNIVTRISLLAQALKNDSLKNVARMGDRKKEINGYKSLVYNESPDKSLYVQHLIKDEKKRLDKLGLWQPSQPDFSIFPQYSMFLQFEFTLATPYISKDDEIFHINENPVRKDKVFKVPMVAATGWKGALRAALWQLEHKEDDKTVIRLFGKPRESEDGPAGRLYFYPTFFDKIGLEVINPHDRKTKAGKHPIYFECVPKDAKGMFSLLYVPFDLIGKEEQKTCTQVATDLELIIKGIQAMFTTYGFGAKTSSGFGTAEITDSSGCITLKYPETKEIKPKPSEPQEPESVQQFKKNYLNEDFSMKPKEWRAKQSSSQKQQERYKQAKEEYRNYRDELNSYPTRLHEWDVSDQTPPSPVINKPFANWEQLKNVLKDIDVLKSGALA